MAEGCVALGVNRINAHLSAILVTCRCRPNRPFWAYYAEKSGVPQRFVLNNGHALVLCPTCGQSRGHQCTFSTDELGPL